MRYELACVNDNCETVVPHGFGPGRHFRHLTLGDFNNDGDDPPRCRVCDQLLMPVREAPFGKHQKFALGELHLTPGVVNLLSDEGIEDPNARAQEAMVTVLPYLSLHANGEWGEVDRHDKKVNNDSMPDNDHPLKRARLMSVYTLNATKVWIMTERGRHETTILLSEEY